MRIDISILASLIFLVPACREASAQNFLQPVKSDASFLSNAGQTKERLQVTSTALLAPGSTNGEPIAGVPGPGSESALSSGGGLNASFTNNQSRTYGGAALPAVSTAAVGINTVDCPFISANANGSDGWVYIPGRIINGQLSPWVNLKETAAEASSFIRQANSPNISVSNFSVP